MLPAQLHPPSTPPFPPISTSLSLPSLTASSFQLSSSASLDAQSRFQSLQSDLTPSSSQNQGQDVDPQILEALRSKDRIYVLKLGELMEDLINDRRSRIDLTPSTSYQRLLVHRCSAYYKLMPENDPLTKGIMVLPTPDSRIPARRLGDLVPAEAITQPAFKIMRRSPSDRKVNKAQSYAGSAAGDDGDLSDGAEPSESGSQGARSNATGSSNKKRMTIEQREAAYNEARSRIFMGFEEKDREKDKDMSASSSSLSLVSGSASTSGGGRSSPGDADDLASSPATESEYSGASGTNPRETKKDSRHIARNASASSSSRSLRSPPASYNSGTGSSRNSRAPSPSPFTFANIYEPHQGQIYDPSQPSPPQGYPPTQYLYPYSPPGQHPSVYFGNYPYYPPYNSYPHPQHSASDPTTPSTGDPYISPPHSGYSHPYGWGPPQHPMQSSTHIQHPSQLLPPPQPCINPTVPPQVPAPQYQMPYMPPQPHTYPYPAPGYYPPQPGQPVEPPHNQSMYDISRLASGVSVGIPPNPNSAPPMGRSGSSASVPNSSRSPNRHNSMNSTKSRGAPSISQGRGGAWSYGPGAGQGGHNVPPVSAGAEIVGPRLSNSRRTSNNSASSSINSRSSNCDDVSSTASSSTTSSSSRRTYTSTASSQHPLPARPDWAVGLKPQPTLHATQSRHHDHSNNSRTMSPISAPRNLNGNSSHNSSGLFQPGQQKPLVPLQSATEFPPLSSVGAPPEKRIPVVAGAWGNSSTVRNIRTLNPGQAHTTVPSSNGLGDGTEDFEDSDRGFDRPPPKSAELFNPKLVLRRPMTVKVQPEKEGARPRGDATTSIIAQVEALALDGPSAEYQLPSEPSTAATM